MRKFCFFILHFFISSCVVGSVTAEEMIPSGKYAAHKSEEFIFISGNRITFHLYDSEKQSFYDKQYKYSVLPDGRIQPYHLTSVDAIFGIGKYDWFLKEGNIHMKNPKIEKLLIFKAVEPDKSE